MTTCAPHGWRTAAVKPRPRPLQRSENETGGLVSDDMVQVVERRRPSPACLVVLRSYGVGGDRKYLISVAREPTRPRLGDRRSVRAPGGGARPRHPDYCHRRGDVTEFYLSLAGRS